MAFGFGLGRYKGLSESAMRHRIADYKATCAFASSLRRDDSVKDGSRRAKAIHYERFLDRARPKSPVNDMPEQWRKNCALTSLGALTGHSAQTVFDNGASRFMGDIRFESQVQGLCRFIQDTVFPRPKVMRVGLTRLDRSDALSEDEGIRRMKAYPIGTRFLVYTTGLDSGGSECAHWLYAERRERGVVFYDYQADLAPDVGGLSSGGTSRSRGSDSVFSLESDPGSGDDASYHSDDGVAGPSSITGDEDGLSGIVVPEEWADARVEDRLDTFGVERERPFPVKYEGMDRFIVEPSRIGFIAVSRP